ncbi:MAG: DUF362 domain-containing protein [Myxococcales bacterium]|nr:DUF362 domain-containing protein [Myxococcales bacterium]
MRPAPRPKVILRHCDSYDPERIRRIVREGMEELGLRPHGRTLLKPNLVASGPLFEHAHTRHEFVEGVLLALRDRDAGQMKELAVGERCGITVPSRQAFEGAGFLSMLKRVGVKPYFFEEEQQVEIPYKHPRRLRDYVFTPEPIALADFFVNCPKFKAHPWTTVTFSIKAYIGIQDDRHRLIDHDHRLNEKIADLQHIIQPELICIDAIIAGEGRMLTPIPRDLNLIIMGNNQVAFDSVCCQIIGVDPTTVDHIRLTSEAGFGPMALEAIELSGDVTLEAARERASGFKVGLIRVEKYFEGTNITAYAGAPPDSERTDYCWGGCPGAIEEAIEILRLYDRECDAKMPRMHVVFGAYDGPIDAKPGEKVVFIGDCATFDGKIGEQVVQIRSKYRDRSTKDPHTARHDDIYVKMAKVTRKLNAARDEQVIRFEGCPVSVAEQALALVRLGGLENPYLSPEHALQFTKNYLMWRSASMAKRLTGTPYQRPGVSPRGEAKPELGVGEPAE